VGAPPSRELARVAQLRAVFGGGGAGVKVGIGDDAAVLEDGLVWTVDAQVEGTHFKLEWVSWEDVGWRSFMAAASDLAAMGAEPVAALSSLVLSAAVDDAALDALARGQAAAARAVGAPIVGGNLARGAESSITTTLLGRAASAVLRAGARPGDGVWLAGPVGLAAAGLALLARGASSGASMQSASVQNANAQNRSVQSASVHGAGVQSAGAKDAGLEACLRAWRRPIARIAEGRALVGVAHAAIDVSDGLSHDAWQLAEASDVRLVLNAAAILASGGDALGVAAGALGRDPLDFALHGGEDYALVAASSSPLHGFVRSGTVEAADPAGGARLLLTTSHGTAPLSPRGFDHFA
jgi:thiamine-monophosphate kinase